MNSRLRFWILFLWLLLPTTARALTVTGVGFSFDLPDDWRAIKRADIQKTLEGGTYPGAVPPLLMAYQPGDHLHPFLYPYVTVRSIANPDNRLVETLPESEIKTLLAGLAGIPEANLQPLPSGSQLPPPDLTGQTAVYFTGRPRYVADSLTHVGEFDIRTHQLGFLGRNFGVIITFAAKDAEFADQAPIVQNIASTFRWAPEQGTTLAPSFAQAHGATVVMTLLLAAVFLYVAFRLVQWFRSE